MSRKSVILIVFGEGGHCTAMQRLYHYLTLPTNDCIQLHEHGAFPLSELTSFAVPRIMPKRGTWWHYIPIPLKLLINLLHISVLFMRYDVRSMITTGPGIAIFPSILLRIQRRQVVFLESWCRFEKMSNTGLLLSRLGAVIYVQNFELVSKRPALQFCGRL